MDIPRQASVTAGLVTALEATWQAIRVQHPDVPDVVLTIGSGTVGTAVGQVRLGHFADARWQRASESVPELFIGGEGLREGACAVLGTLLHEAAHGVASCRGVKDTSRQGRYHNRDYKALAVELGLTVEQVGAIGWSATAVPPETADRYAAALAAIETALVAYRNPEPRGKGAQKNKNGVVVRCGCPRQFRVTWTVLDAGPIICGVCDSDFIEAE